MRKQIRSASGFSARFTGIAAGLAAMLAPGAAAQAQRMTPSAAPVEWVQYAEISTATFRTWLEERGEVPSRLRPYLTEVQANAGEPIAIEIKLWIAADGTIDRIDFKPFAHAPANADLRSLIVGRRLAPPPKDMLLPMRIGSQLTPEAASPETFE